ncbi:hypothetical protein SK128_019753 [Halocaridina rubra]|uniref:Uncharacterized protein n=1 Tax=Halocaridina rubra TaxID=373956 RepID=A0AAN9A9W9_HALRR
MESSNTNFDIGLGEKSRPEQSIAHTNDYPTVSEKALNNKVFNDLTSILDSVSEYMENPSEKRMEVETDAKSQNTVASFGQKSLIRVQDSAHNHGVRGSSSEECPIKILVTGPKTQAILGSSDK